MPLGREARLARLQAAATLVDLAEGLNRCTLRAWVAVWAVVSDGLARAGIDPGRAGALPLGEAAATRLAGLGDTPELRRADEDLAARDRDGLAGKFAAKIGEMAERYQDGCEPDFAKASLAELFAWCFARPVRGPGRPA